jgi:hypothetical protein
VLSVGGEEVGVYFPGWKPDIGYDVAIEGVQIRGGVMEVQVVSTNMGN